jgi:hypothetical protein
VFVAERKAPAGTISGPCLRTDWLTPPDLLEAVRNYFGGQIPLDPATVPDNPTGAEAFCVEPAPPQGVLFDEPLGRSPAGADGLRVSWGRAAFVNPPYGKVIRRWLAKIVQEAAAGCEIVALLPCARWEQAYLHDALRCASAIWFKRGRVDFVNPETGDAVSGNPYASMMVGWNVDRARWAAALGHLGLVLFLEAS